MKTNWAKASDILLATDPPVSEKQRRAMEAAAHGHSTLGISKKVAKEFLGKDVKPAAGIVFMAPDQRALFIKRSANSDHPGTWAFPGGGVEDGETEEEAARREATEETGFKDEVEFKKVDQQTNDQTAFTTFQANVGEHFLPTLNDEHTAHAWAPLNDPPLPLHPGVKASIERGAFAHDSAIAMDWVSTPRVKRTPLALDRASVRRVDHDGRLHVETTNISKANVCPYLGREIPGWRELGLDADKVYQLYRDPDEIAKAVSTFNNIPLLSQHIEVSADDHQPDYVVGSTGTDATFEAPYLKNSLVIWAKDMIRAVENKEQKELSSAYRYRADMTPGVINGTKYDGVMRDIIGNHVALVKEGRAGADVVVGDSKEELNMKQLSRKAVLTQGALTVYLLPKLAQDAKINILPAIKGLTQKNFAKKKPVLAAWVKEATEGKLAQDADVGDVIELLDNLEKIDAPDVIESATGGEVSAEPVDDAEVNGREAFLKSKLSDEDFAHYMSLEDHNQGVDEKKDDDKDDKKDNKAPPFAAKDAPPTAKAMDAAIAKAKKEATEEATKIQQEIRAAEKSCEPYVGAFAVTFDSAEQVYRTTLEMLKVEGIDDVHASALPVILKQQPLPGTKKPTTVHIAADAATTSNFNKRFPDASRIGNL